MEDFNKIVAQMLISGNRVLELEQERIDRLAIQAVYARNARARSARGETFVRGRKKRNKDEEINNE